jgi:hypothetical protein
MTIIIQIYGTTESEAKKIAKRVSKMKTWHEVEIKGLDKNGEITHHSYWQNGKLQIDMSV